MTATPRVRAWAVFRRLTASENLHQVGHWAAYEAIQKPDIQHSLAPAALRPFKSDTLGN
jgi:hypothetical protein